MLKTLHDALENEPAPGSCSAWFKKDAYSDGPKYIEQWVAFYKKIPEDYFGHGVIFENLKKKPKQTLNSNKTSAFVSITGKNPDGSSKGFPGVEVGNNTYWLFVNDAGSFFNERDPMDNIWSFEPHDNKEFDNRKFGDWPPGQYPGNTNPSRAWTLLHELAHFSAAPGFIQNDGVDDQNGTSKDKEAHNNQLVHEHCGRLIASIP